MINNDLSTICHKWPIFQRCSYEVLGHIQSFMVIGSSCDDVLMIANPDDSDYTAKIWAIGKNDYGILGLGHRNAVSVPKQIVEFDGNDIVDIRHGERHVLVLTKDELVYAWGHNEYGQCGNGSFEAYNCLRPTQVKSGEKFVSIRCGNRYSMALTSDGKIFAWGYNGYGQIGVGNQSNQSTPVRVKGLDSEQIIAIESGGWHSMALTKNGVVYSWGDNASGRLGNGNTGDQMLPVKIQIDGATFKAISPGLLHSLVLTNDGQIYGFGKNDLGQLGCQTEQDRMPTPVKMSTKLCFSTICSYHNLTVAKTESGECYIWGEWIYPEPLREPFKIGCVSFNHAFSHYLKKRSTPYLFPMDTSTEANPVLNRLQSMFNKEEGSDLAFHLGDNKIFAHRGFLQLCSPYLNRMLSECWQQERTIEISDFEYSVFHAYLQYLYTGNFKVNPDEAAQLLTLSHRFLEPSLTTRCIELLRPAITVDNCCILYQIAEVCQLDSFQKYIVHFISKNLINVYRSEEYRNMNPKFAQSIGIKLGEIESHPSS